MPTNTTTGILQTEPQPRLFFVKSQFPVKSLCERVDQSYFYSPAIIHVCKVLAVLAACVFAWALIPTIAVYCVSSPTEMDVLSVTSVQDVVLTTCNGVSMVRWSILLFSCCSAFVSRVRPEINWDPWYAKTSLGIDMSWISWILTASASGMYLYGITYFAQDAGMTQISPLRGMVVPSLVNTLIPLARLVIDASHASTVWEHDYDWAAQPSPLFLGALELVFAGVLYMVVTVVVARGKHKVHVTGVMRLEPYNAAIVCYNTTRMKHAQNRIPGWLLTLGGYRVRRTNGSTTQTLIRDNLACDLAEDNRVIEGSIRGAHESGFYGRPILKGIE